MVAPCDIQQDSPAAGQTVGLPLDFLCLNPLPRSGAQPEAVELIEGIARFPIGGVLRVVGAGIGVAALIVVVAGYIDDGADAQGASESDGEAMAGIAVVPCRIEQEAEPSYRCALGQAVAHVDIVAVVVDEQPHPQPSGGQSERSPGIGIVSVEIDDDGSALCYLDVGIVLRIDPETIKNSYKRHSNGPLKRGMRFEGARPINFGTRKSPVKI